MWLSEAGMFGEIAILIMNKLVLPGRMKDSQQVKLPIEYEYTTNK